MNWKRYLIIGLSLLLLLSLRLAWSGLTWQPEITPGKKSAVAAVAGADAGLKVTKPPAVLPDLLDGYIFNAVRKLDPADTLAFGGGRESEIRGQGNLDNLLYSGSIIVGDRRQALVSYPVKIRDSKTGREKETIRHRVLSPGEKFNGYQVAAVEPLRLVFTLNGEKVVKQLYDKEKKRRVVSRVSKAVTREVRRLAPPPVVKRSVPSPVTPAVRRLTPQRQSRTAADTPGVSKPATRSQRRMQRLKLENPNIFIPEVPGGAPAQAGAPPAAENP